MKAIKNTTLTCGLLNAPVKIFAAAGNAPEVKLNYCTPEGDPVERIYVRAQEQSEREWINRDGTFLRVVEPFELASLGRSYEGSQVNLQNLATALEESQYDESGNDLTLINVERFVPLKEVPFERSIGLYYLGPNKQMSAKSFEIFKAALKKKKVAAIAKVVLRSRQILLAIYEKNGILHAQVLNFLATMNQREDEELGDPDSKPRKAEVDAMGDLIDALTTEAREIDDITDTYVEGKRVLVEDLIKGQEVGKKERRKTKAKSDPDSLLEALNRSVEEAQKKSKV